MANRSKPRVAVVLTGGTIEAIGFHRLDLAFYIETKQRIQPGELLGRVPELSEVAEVSEIPFGRVTSHAMTDDDIAEIAETVAGLFERDEADGVVVTQGTNTIEEVSYTLHLTIKSDRPVVVAGAMRPSSGIGHEGELNLLNAVRVAASPESVGVGTVVLLDDTIHSARDVSKANSMRVWAFQSRDAGPIGMADSDARVIYAHRPARPHSTATPFEVSDLRALPRADLVTTYQGSDGSSSMPPWQRVRRASCLPGRVLAGRRRGRSKR